MTTTCENRDGTVRAQWRDVGANGVKGRWRFRKPFKRRFIALDSAGHAFLAGATASTDFPTVSPFQSSIAGGASYYSGADAFIT
ncbi:MAG: hypothetical protein U0793_28265, partial [Gemmataceae bacterium]